jgi:hypothetical protein
MRRKYALALPLRFFAISKAFRYSEVSTLELKHEVLAKGQLQDVAGTSPALRLVRCSGSAPGIMPGIGA